MLSETVLSVLRESGWYPTRKMPIIEWCRSLEVEGFTVNAIAKDVLEKFGGLKITPLKTEQDVYVAEVLRFDPILAASGDFDRIDYWQRHLKTQLSPIAEIGGGAALLLADDGRVFSCRDDVLWFDGSSFEEALEKTLVVAKRRPIEVARMS